MIDISGIDKARLLLALWRNAKIQHERRPTGELVHHVSPPTRHRPARHIQVSKTDLHPIDCGELTLEGAQIRVAPHPDKSQNFFTYVLGRILMVHLDGGHMAPDHNMHLTVRVPLDVLDERVYDRANGVGAAQRAVDEARRAVPV